MIPISIENTTAITDAGTLMDTATPETLLIIWAIPIPAATPMMPPILVSTAASVRNCPKIVPLGAPMAFFNPISLVRSVTDTSIIFITPIPPTSREMLAIQISWLLVEELRSCSFWARSRTSSALYFTSVCADDMVLFRISAVLRPASSMSSTLVAFTITFSGSS